MAFEICGEQDRRAEGALHDHRVAAGKAKKLVGRGVQRVFCIVIGGPLQKRRPGLEKSYVAEWLNNEWSPLSEDVFSEDECLSTPLPIRALLDATASDDAVVHALKARGNQAIRKMEAKAEAKGVFKGRAKGFAEGESKGRAEGRAEGQAATLVSILELRGFAMADEDRQRILGCRDLDRLERWTRQALSIDSIDELWSDD